MLLWQLVLLCLLGMSWRSLHLTLTTGESNLPFKGMRAIKIFREIDPNIFWLLVILNVLAVALCVCWLIETGFLIWKKWIDRKGK